MALEWKDEFTDQLCDSIVAITDREEAYRFLEDVATFSEIRAFAPETSGRELLLKGCPIPDSTGDRQQALQRSQGKKFVEYGSDGYRDVLAKLEKTKKKKTRKRTRRRKNKRLKIASDAARILSLLKGKNCGIILLSRNAARSSISLGGVLSVIGMNRQSPLGGCSIQYISRPLRVVPYSSAGSISQAPFQQLYQLFRRCAGSYIYLLDCLSGNSSWSPFFSILQAETSLHLSRHLKERMPLIWGLSQ
jgi:TrpR-related protein YerC/YecD